MRQGQQKTERCTEFGKDFHDNPFQLETARMM